MSDAADDVQIVFDSKPYKQPDEGLMGKNIAIAEKEMFCHLKIPPIILPHWIPGAEDVEIINEMLKLRINEMFPGFCEVLHVPTLEGIIQHLHVPLLVRTNDAEMSGTTTATNFEII
uniref:Uncharacterized protein n=1 Tax=Caenorhabditis japonica TaxID=281687 RepID=A0A8R1DNR7_CAEJA